MKPWVETWNGVSLIACVVMALAGFMVSFFSGGCAAATILVFVSLAAAAVDVGPDNSGYWWRKNTSTAVAFLVLPAATTLVGSVLNHHFTESSRRERAALEARNQELESQRLREEAASTARRAAEAERAERATALAILTEQRRTPAERAARIRDLLSGDGDAGTMTGVQRVCCARVQVAQIPAAAWDSPGVREALRLLRRAERSALEEVREDARGYRMVRCCDGASSPTCECRRSSYRGCCSWHGGVCGCESLPTEITCASN